MGVFSTRQTRQFYVMNQYNENLQNKGDVKVASTGDTMYIQTKGAAGVTRSDLINVNSIMYINATDATKSGRYLKKATITLNQDYDLQVGQDYILNIKIKNLLSIGDEPALCKFGMVHVVKGTGTDASAFYKKLALSLVSNFNRLETPALKVYVKTASSKEEVTTSTKEASLTGTYTGLILEEVEQEWVLGEVTGRPINFEVWTSFVTDVDTSEEFSWGEIEYGKSESYVGNGKIIADMEHFYMGERGDIYRDNGCHNFHTEYLVDPSKEYYTLDIHYYTQLSNESVQKSEKDITIVSASKEAMNSLIENINSEAGTNVKSFA